MSCLAGRSRHSTHSSDSEDEDPRPEAEQI